MLQVDSQSYAHEGHHVLLENVNQSSFIPSDDDKEQAEEVEEQERSEALDANAKEVCLHRDRLGKRKY